MRRDTLNDEIAALRPDGRVRGRDDAGRRRQADARRGLQEGRRLHAVPGPRAVRGAGAQGQRDCRCSSCSAGIVGCIAGFGLCYWVSVIAYPLNIGGRPFNSWPSFIPVTFEVTILLASLTCGRRHDPAQRPADAVPPGVQRQALRRAREPGRPVPRDRSGRSEVRRRRRRARSSRSWERREVNDIEP